MATYKVYRKGNYLEVVDNDNGQVWNGLVYEAYILKIHEPFQYRYKFVLSADKVLDRILLEDIEDENGDPYTEEAFDTFRTCKLGYMPIGFGCGESINLYNMGYENYTEVAVSSAQILDMNSNPVVLLPQVPSNKYYQFKMAIEYTGETASYTMTNPWGIYGSNVEYVEYPNTSLGQENLVFRLSSENYNATGLSEGLGTPVTLTTLGGSNPTLGDGTMLVKIWYTVRTFGTEL